MYSFASESASLVLSKLLLSEPSLIQAIRLKTCIQSSSSYSFASGSERLPSYGTTVIHMVACWTCTAAQIRFPARGQKEHAQWNKLERMGAGGFCRVVGAAGGDSSLASLFYFKNVTPAVQALFSRRGHRVLKHSRNGIQ